MSYSPPPAAPSPYNQPPPPDEPEAAPQQARQITVKLPARHPTLTYIILGLTVLVFFGQYSTQFVFGYDLFAVYGMKINEYIVAGQLWRLFTPMLLHSTGNLLHIGFNMYALYVMGPNLERQFGHGRFLALYILSGFAGNVVSMLFSDAPSLGASTAIFGLLAAQGVFIYQNRKVMGQRAQMVLRNIASIAFINFIIGLTPGIDNWGHLGGFAGGALFTWLAGPLLEVEGIFPAFTVADSRETGDTVRGAVAVGGLFTILAMVAIYLGFA